MSEHNILGAILAGGQSRRMGKDKLFLELNNKKLIEHTIEKVKKYLKQVIIVTNQNNLNTLSEYPFFSGKEFQDNETNVFVCKNFSCSLPLSDLSEIEKEL